MALIGLEAAKKACARSKWKLSNLELQKILYIAQVRYKRQFPQKRLIDTTFEAWDLGPVSPEVYHRAKIFGSARVQNVFHNVTETKSELDGYLYDTVDKMSGKTPGELVAITHRTGGAWATFYAPGVFGVKIPDSAIDKEAMTFSSP